MKKETIEEAFEKWNEEMPKGYAKLDELRFGAKGQGEKSYREEEMRKAFNAGGNSNITEDNGYNSRYLKYMDEWFNKFKKK